MCVFMCPNVQNFETKGRRKKIEKNSTPSDFNRIIDCKYRMNDWVSEFIIIVHYCIAM